MSRRRQIVWEWVDEPGVEHLVLDLGPDGVVADSLVVGEVRGARFRVRYRIACDPRWRFRDATIAVDGGASPKSIAIARDAAGAWAVDGVARPDLTACTDIDVMVTPFTNTLPIRNRRWRPDMPQRFSVVYVRLPDLAVASAAQEYTRLAPRRFRYRGLDPGFTAEIDVDRDGIVTDYAAIWRRRAG